MATADLPIALPGVTPPNATAYPKELLYSGGPPMESTWHRDCMNLFIECIKFLRDGRTDFFVGGDMFLYFDPAQIRKNKFLGPDVFLVNNVDGTKERKYWAAWEENNRLPDVIIELTSPTTEKNDRTHKYDTYQNVFRTHEYFIYHPYRDRLDGYRLVEDEYEPIAPDASGRMWSESIGAFVGRWQGNHLGTNAVWLRLYDGVGRLVPKYAEHERSRADAAEAELARLRDEIERLRGGSK